MPKPNPYYSGPVTDHFDGRRFHNPGGTAPRGFGDVLKWHFREKRARWPKWIDGGPPPGKPSGRVEGDRLRVTMVGHATMLVQVAGLNILTDPVWSDRVSPLSFIGPRRHREPGIRFDDLPRIDLVLLSHNHYDHLDLDTLARLHTDHDPLVVTPLGNDRIVRAGVPEMRIRVGDWGDAVSHGPATIHLEPCHHWSARSTRDRSMALWAAFAVETPAGSLFHIGDTGFDDGRPYRHARRKHGPFRFAILPIGAYEPRWFMKAQHQNPEEAVKGFSILEAGAALGHHWGTFQLTNEPIEEPRQRLSATLSERGIDSRRFRTLLPGEAWDVPADR